MSVNSFFSKLFNKKCQQSDCIQTSLYGLDISMTRITNCEIPHEVTVVIPRAEVREKYNEKGNLIEKEILLNSITVVHAPRHPLAGPASPLSETPDGYQSINFKRKPI